MAQIYQKKIQITDYKKEFLIDLYHTMVKIRKFDENLIRLMQEGKVSGFYHSGIGSEALSAGAIKMLGDEDYIFYNHRGCNQKIAKGIPLSKLYGDFLGTLEGTTGGLGAGIVHSADASRGVLGQAGTIGSQFNIAVGSGYSAKLRETDQVTQVFFGDGAASREPLHGSLNWAGLYKLPIIYICENNEYAISCHYKDTHAIREHIADWSYGYGIPGYVVDGNDVLLVYKLVNEAVERAKRGEGPTFIEALTFRHRGHYEGDPNKYIDSDVLADWKTNKDPIQNYKKRLVEAGVSTERDFVQIDEEVQDEIHRAIQIAEAAPVPGPNRIWQGLFT